MRLRILIATIILFSTMQLEQIAIVDRNFLQTNETSSSNKNKQCSNIKNSKTNERFNVKKK